MTSGGSMARCRYLSGVRSQSRSTNGDIGLIISLHMINITGHYQPAAISISETGFQRRTKQQIVLTLPCVPPRAWQPFHPRCWQWVFNDNMLPRLRCFYGVLRVQMLWVQTETISTLMFGAFHNPYTTRHLSSRCLCPAPALSSSC